MANGLNLARESAVTTKVVKSPGPGLAWSGPHRVPGSRDAVRRQPRIPSPGILGASGATHLETTFPSYRFLHMSTIKTRMRLLLYAVNPVQNVLV